MEGRTVRERAQALIDIAHPDDQASLVEADRKRKIVYPNQIFIAESTHLYPADITAVHTFRGDIKIRFRAIRPSDEEGMRHLFYRFSDEAVYYRYFHSIRSMLIRLARERGIKGFVADVLFSNTGMMQVFQKRGLPVKAHLEGGVFNLVIPFAAE